MTELGVIPFHRIGIGFAFRDFIPAKVIAEKCIRIQAIPEVLLCFRSLIHHFLETVLCALPDDFPAKDTACCPIYDGDDVDFVFFVFFVQNESENLVQFSRFYLLWHGRFRQILGVILNPQRYSPVMNFQMTANPAQVHPVHIQLHRMLTHFRSMVPGFLLQRVFPATSHTPVALTSGNGLPGTILSFDTLAFWTSAHATYYLTSPSVSHSPAQKA